MERGKRIITIVVAALRKDITNSDGNSQDETLGHWMASTNAVWGVGLGIS
jgi:hypothetical protein